METPGITVPIPIPHSNNLHNNNEILLVRKTSKNQGFFEKFFNFFS